MSTQSKVVAILSTLISFGCGAAEPDSEEMEVWQAVSRHVFGNEAAAVPSPRQLNVLSKTSYPMSDAVLTKLADSAEQGICALSAKESKALVSDLRKKNSKSISTRLALSSQHEIAIVDSRPQNGDYIGLSRPVFDARRNVAYLSVEISGESGSIIEMIRKEDKWTFNRECTTWVSW